VEYADNWAEHIVPQSVHGNGAFANSAPYVGYRAGNFINERIGSYYLPDYASTKFTNYAVGDNSTTWDLTTSKNIVYLNSNGSSSRTLLEQARVGSTTPRLGSQSHGRTLDPKVRHPC
jgi:hypothetical protein